jgi:hypothetical protein
MTVSRARLAFAASLLALLAGVLVWRNREASAPVAASRAASTADVSPSRRRELESLRTRLLSEGPRAVSADRPEKSEANLLTHLAETSDDPRVIEASLHAIPSMYAARSTKKLRPDAALERVLAKHVSAERPSTALAALSAARVSLMTERPSDVVTSAISALAAPEQPAARRHAALEALNLVRPDRRAPHVLSAFERALEAKEPSLVSLALLGLSHSRASVEAAPQASRQALATRIDELLRHYDPGVRGQALAVLAEIPTLFAADARFQAAEAASVDRDAYVRARAADLLARCRDPLAIHLLVGHVGDLSLARYELSGWTQLDGTHKTLVHELPGRERVAEAALFAISSLSEVLELASPLTLTLGNGHQSDERVLENAELARSWYRAHQALIPRSPAAR